MAAFWFCLAWVLLTTGAHAALTAGKTVTPNTVTVGVPTPVNFTLTVTNTSTFANEVVITDDLPPGLTFNAMIDFRLNGVTQVPGPAPTIVGNRLTWDNGGLGHQVFAGQNVRIRFSGVMTAATQGRFASEVRAVDLTGQPDDPPDDVPVTALNQAQITAGAFPTLTNNLARAPAGTIPLTNLVTFTNTINNNGGFTADNLRSVVPMPPGWTYDGTFTPTWGGVAIGAPAISGQTLTFSGLGSINVGGPAKQLVYRLRAPNAAGTDGHSARIYADNASAVNSNTLNITVGAATGVSVTQSFISNTNPVPGEVVSFELTIANAGPTSADLTEIRHDFQGFFNYDSGTGAEVSLNGGPFVPFQHPDNYVSNPATLIWTNIGGSGLPVTLAAGDSLVLHFNRIAPVNRTGAWTCRGRADGSNFIQVLSPLTTITIDGPVYTTALEVVTSPPQVQVLPGQIQYRITVTNVGSGAGFAVPDWLAPVSPTTVWTHVDDAFSTVAQINGGPADTTNPTVTGGRDLRWKAGVGYLLNPGDVLTVEFTVTVPAGTTPGQYPTRTRVSDAVYTANGSLTTADSAPVTVIAMPTVDLSMTATPSVVAKPATVTYAITVRNNSNSPGPVNSLSLVRTNPNPGGWSVVAGSTVVTWSRPQTPPNAAQAGNGTTYNVASWLQTYGGGQPRLNPGEWVTITYQYQINVSSPNGTYTSSVLGSGSNIIDVNTGPTAPVTVDQPAMATVTKSVTPTSVPAGGGVVQYTIAIQNTGSVNLTGSQTFDDLPAGFNYIPGSSQRSYNGTTWTAISEPTNISGNTWRWITGATTINTVGPSGPTMWIRFQAVTAAASGTYDNVVRYQATQLSQISTGPTAPVTVGTPPVLSLNLSLSPASIPAGGPGRATYTMTLQNIGGTTADDVTIQAVLPGYLGYVAGSSDMTIAAPAPDPLVNTQLTWNNLGDIPAGQTMTFSWQVAADASAPAGTYYMEASASGANFGSVSTGGPPSGGSSIPPLTVTSAASVVLTAFQAEARPDGVQLRWRSGSEWQHLGYMPVRRAVGESTELALADHLIGGPGNQVGTRDYTWRDTAVVPGTTYDYWLEDVEIGGMISRHGPIRIQVPQSGQTTVAWTPPQVTLDPPTTAVPAKEILSAGQASRPLIDVIAADDSGITFDLRTLPLQALEEGDYTRVVIPGLPTIQEDGKFELPMAVTALGLPSQATYRLTVLERAEPIVLNGASPPVVHFSGGSSGRVLPSASPQPRASTLPATSGLGPRGSGSAAGPVMMQRMGTSPPSQRSVGTREGNHLAFAFGVLSTQGPFPAVAAEAEQAVALRDMDLVRLRVYPVSFDPGTQTITQYRRLRVRVDLDSPASLRPHPLTDGAALTAFDAALHALSADQGVLRRWHADRAFDDGVRSLPAGGLRLAVTTAGLHRVSAARLTAAGLDLSHPDRLQLFHRGRQVPLDLQLSAGAVTAVTFHAVAVGNRYEDKGLYDLVVGDGPGVRMATFEATPDAAAVTSASRRTVVQEGHAHYVGNSPAHASSDHWFMDYLVSGHADVTTTLRIPDPLPMGQQARLQVDLASLTAATADRQDNRVAIELNGQSVGEAIWGGARYEQASFNIEASRLQPGDNTLRLRLVGSTNAIVYLDRVTVTYDAPWRPDQTVPAGVVTGGAFQATVPAATSQTTVYRVGMAGEPAVGTGTSLAGDVLTFGADAGAGSAYAIVTADDPALTIIPRPTATIDLREPGRQAENLIIAPTALLAEAERLAAYRTSQGLKSLAIPVESIYEAFAGGHREPTAIRDFLRWAVHNWQDPKPSYVLLFGDGHYDPLNWANQASPAPNPLPPLMTDTSMVGEVPNDTALASLDGDKGLPSFFIGRLPVNTLAEARLVVDKVIAYEGAEGAWLKEAIGAFDDNDARFEQTLDRVIGQMGDRTWSRFGITQALALKDRLQQGAGLTLYVGHGSDWGWADEDIFNGDDLAAFAPNGRTGLLVAANCLNGYFSSPWYAGLGEALIVQDRAGSVAFLGTSGFTLPANQERMMSDLFRHLSAGRDLGMASTLAKLNLFLRGDPLWHDELSGWVLLGDPATKLHL